MGESVLVVLWLIVGTALAWFVMTRFQTWLGRRVNALDEASRAPKDDERANDLARLWGFAVAAGGVGFLALGSGWTLWGVVPLRVFGAVGLLFGGWMLTFPSRYRELRSRYRR